MKTPRGTTYAELRRLALSFDAQRPTTRADAEQAEASARRWRDLTGALIARAMWSAWRHRQRQTTANAPTPNAQEIAA